MDDRVQPVPRPYPNHDLLPTFKYLNGPSTPLYKADGSLRDIDDFNPRVQMKALYDSGELNSANTNAVKEPSKRLIIGENLVLKILEHLENLKLKNNKRAEAKRSCREAEDRKTYKDYDWINLYRTNEWRKVTGKVVEKYLCHFKLPKVRLVSEKLKIVQHHIERTIFVSKRGIIKSRYT